MTGFVVAALGLLGLAWYAVVPGLWPRPQQGSPRWPVLLLALAIPSLAVPLYLRLGNPGALDVRGPAAPMTSEAAAPSGGGPVTPVQIQAMVNKLAARLKTQPDDAEGWRMLARSYDNLHRFDEAVGAYQNLVRLRPNDAAAWLDYAVTLGMAHNSTLAGEPERLIQHALQIEPDNMQALALLGSVAFERKDYAQAASIWQRVLVQVPPDSDVAHAIGRSVDKARALSKAGGTDDGGSTGSAGATSASSR